MIQMNEYFDGKVKSLGFQADGGRATVGVMAPGDYEFGTAEKEIVTVTSGALTALLPGASDWQTFGAGATFEVPGNSRFQLKVARDTAYLCLYV